MVTASGRALSWHELRKAGWSHAAIQSTIVIAFGTDAGVFDAIAPEGYVTQGEWKPLTTLEEHFT